MIVYPAAVATGLEVKHKNLVRKVPFVTIQMFSAAVTVAAQQLLFSCLDLAAVFS